MTEPPENVTLDWLARYLLSIREEVSEMRGDLDRLTVLARQLHEESIVQGAALVRIERRLERLERERQS
jgi:hypothetical protein